ncbi:antitoxin Xre/MbcA/ParS toxin-binding domain-containing protein [Pseudomonas coronafaciens]|uniref:antitoxin Xre/MbcA/ParS toxin-binding domain-containing protein n=1 Tax=Pseudomonas coronafaciens TaxID=53409 RepID=UPI00378CC654
MNPQLQTQVLEIMGAPQREPLDTFIREGVPLIALEYLAQRGVSAVAVGVLTSRTLHRRRVKREQLSRAEGDRLYRVSMILLRSEQVFGHPDKARRWLSTAHRFLDGMTAWEAVATTPGYVAVLDNLERIHQGYFA